MNEHGHECWIVETSKDGEKWRFFGRAWKRPGQEVLAHGVPRFVRFRPTEEPEWREALERTTDHPMTLLDMDAGVRHELWPDQSHHGLPVLLPGGEAGALVSFEHHDDPVRWNYTLEFRGQRE